MNAEPMEAIIITERVNGWWVTARYQSGHEEHHGPYDDEATANQEAELLNASGEATQESQP